MINIFEDESKVTGTNYILKIENEELGIAYYYYQPKYKNSFDLEIIEGLKIPDNFYCEKVSKSKDAFNDEVKYQTPEVNGISLLAVEEDGKKTFYMSLKTRGATANVYKKGVILLLKNDEKINKPMAKVKLRVDTKGKGYNYSSFISLNEDELNKIIENPITAFRLYIHDKHISNGKKISEFLKCMKK